MNFVTPGGAPYSGFDVYYYQKATPMNLLERITLNQEVCQGKPTIRNMRFTVAQMLELLAGEMTHEEILDDYPYIEKEDIQACLTYASRVVNARSVSPSNAA